MENLTEQGYKDVRRPIFVVHLYLDLSSQSNNDRFTKRCFTFSVEDGRCSRNRRPASDADEAGRWERAPGAFRHRGRVSSF